MALCVFPKSRKQYRYAVPNRAQIGDEVRRPAGLAIIVGFDGRCPGGLLPAELTGRRSAEPKPGTRDLPTTGSPYYGGSGRRGGGGFDGAAWCGDGGYPAIVVRSVSADFNSI